MTKKAKQKQIRTGGTEKNKRGRPAGSNAKETILKGAITAFADNGFHDCTVAAILSASGVSRTNFYRFFDSKEEVFETIAEQSIGRLNAKMQQAFIDAEALKGDDEKIDHVLSVYLHTCFDAGPLLTVLMQREFTSANHQDLREKTIVRFKKGIANLIVQAGYQNPDPLMLEALLAAIERIVVLLSKRKASSAVKFRTAHDRIIPLVDAVTELFK